MKADCFGWLFNYAKDLINEDTSDLQFVHAKLRNPRTNRRYWHAFVIDTFINEVYDHETGAENGMDLEFFEDLFVPTDVRIYSPEEILKNALKYKHMGPWKK